MWQFITEYWAGWLCALIGGAILAAIPKIKALWDAVLALALVNQLLSAAGKPVLPIDSASVEQWVTAGLTTAAAIWAWWENNSFTPEAIRADELLDQMQGKK